jgi:II/X family phage/plasmid replication protein
MIDTIKFFVSIEDDETLNRIRSTSEQTKRENLKTEEVKYVYHTAEIKVGSYDKSINVRIVDNIQYKGLYIEFSVPKYAKGNNIEMLLPSELPKVLEKFQQETNAQLDINLPHFSAWEIFRIDLCYNWIFQNKEETETVIEFFKRLDYPHKKKVPYPTSVTFLGSAYLIRFYLKYPEYLAHDYKDLSEDDKISDRTLTLLGWASRIVRFEVEFKKQYVKEIFGYKKVFVEHVQDDENIEEILRYYLNDKVLKYITLKNTTELQVEELLYSNFSKSKATRLYQFYRDFYLGNGAVKSRMLAGGLNRSTINRYKRDLKRVGIGFDVVNTFGVSLLEQCVIPSENSRFDLVDILEREPENEGGQELV